MPRPCNHPDDQLPEGGKPYEAGTCRLCWLFVNDQFFRKVWEGQARQPETFRPKFRHGCRCGGK